MFIVTPSNGRFNTYSKAVIDESSPLRALKAYLKQNGITYNRIEKLTTKALSELYNKGMTPLQVASYIDFAVSPDEITSANSGGSYRLS